MASVFGLLLSISVFSLEKICFLLLSLNPLSFSKAWTQKGRFKQPGTTFWCMAEFVWENLQQ
jgi:hypothetical protein